MTLYMILKSRSCWTKPLVFIGRIGRWILRGICVHIHQSCSRTAATHKPPDHQLLASVQNWYILLSFPLVVLCFFMTHLRTLFLSFIYVTARQPKSMRDVKGMEEGFAKIGDAVMEALETCSQNVKIFSPLLYPY